MQSYLHTHSAAAAQMNYVFCYHSILLECIKIYPNYCVSCLNFSHFVVDSLCSRANLDEKLNDPNILKLP